ncbi:MAG: ThiF family adenylyltransferase, partial [Firmicutes bacterium]|nr:ThiF family adenylyltransferase [Bacillota bacterium]
NGQIMPIVPGKTPCLRCLFPKGYRSGAADKAILGATAGLIGSMQAMAAYKLLLGMEEVPAMLVWDGEQGICQRVELSPDPNCRCQQGK